MELKIYWTKFSEEELRQIFDYHLKKANHSVAKKLINGIIDVTLNLKNQPNLGQIEELLKTRPQEFRYLIHKHYKIIYWINLQKKQIEIIDVFDTRQNPTNISRTK